MRETCVAQASIFENYSKHGFGTQLRALSNRLYQHPEILPMVADDLIDASVAKVGRTGLTVENIFRCMLLKQQLRLSYEQLAFHLSDSITYRTFARLSVTAMPSRFGLQSTIRSIKPETLEKVHETLSISWLKAGILSLEKLRIDSAFVAITFARPSESQLLNDGVRVLSRLLMKGKNITGVKIRFTDQRKVSMSLAFQIFNAKKARKEALYPKLLQIVKIVLKQVERELDAVEVGAFDSDKKRQWVSQVEQYRDLTMKAINQAERRVIQGKSVHSSEKVVSLLESHTDIIVKGFRDVQYGHKISLSSERSGFITYLCIEKGNPADFSLFMPVLDFHQSKQHRLPHSVVADGGYARQENVEKGRGLGDKRVVFYKPVGLSLHAMGVKLKTFTRLRHFRAGVEGNISELKRAFGAKKANWKGLAGFKAYVWSSVLSYNLMRLARLDSG